MPQPIHIPPTKTVGELSEALTFILNNVITSINNEKPSHDQDANSHRITNLGSPTRSSDAVNVEYLERRLEKQFSHLKNSTIRYVNSQIGQGPQLLVGTHTERALYDALSIEQGSLFYETDRTALYQVQGGVWKWVGGVMRDTLTNKPTDLGTDDTGFLFYGTDYLHTWRWNGSGWTYAPGDRASGEFGMFSDDPGAGWATCNGSTVTRSNPDATTSSFTTPDFSGAFVKGGAYTGGTVLPVAPTLGGLVSSEGAGTPTGTVSSTFTGTPANTSTPSSTTSVTGGAGSAGDGSHTHSYTPAGSVSSSFTGNPLGFHTHNVSTVTVSTTGEPRHVLVEMYVRL